MQRSENLASSRTSFKLLHFAVPERMGSFWLLLVAGTLFLSACGSGSSSSPQSGGPLAGNWQFVLTPPSDGSFTGNPSPSCPTPPGALAPICSGGFLLQDKGSVSGSVVYSITAPPSGNNPAALCGGSAPVTGTISGQNVALTMAAGAQTFSLTGTLSANGSTMTGTYSSTDGKACGPAQSGLKWSATSVPSFTGPVQGVLHSATGSLSNQNFSVAGSLAQGNNIGASTATITGTLNFQGYSCLSSASVNGQISGSSVILKVIATSGLTVGQIGAFFGSSSPSPVVYQSAAGGPVMSGTNGYAINTSSCSTGDAGNICLALGNSTARDTITAQ